MVPGGVKLEYGFFQASNVERRLNGLYRDFLLALAIVSITLLPLGLRAAGVVMFAIPLSLLAGLAILQALGFGLNQLSISGFVLSLRSEEHTSELQSLLRLPYVVLCLKQKKKQY